MRIASVILDIPSQGLDTLYSYIVPESMEDAQVGCAAVVPFGHRIAIGFIVAVEEGDGSLLEERGLKPQHMKPLIEIASKPYFDEDGAACALHLAKSCIAPLSTCIRLFTPPGGVPKAKKSEQGWMVEYPAIGEVDDRFVRLTEEGRGYVPPVSAIRQRAVLEALQAGELRMAELSLEFSSASTVVAALEKRGFVKVEHRRRFRGGDQSNAQDAWTRSAVPESMLNECQLLAIEEISKAVETADGSVVLVDGVTGSGKTEVYLRAIEPVISRGKRALVLVPEISLTPQTVARFRGRFGERVAVMHSRMSAGERFDQWDYIRSGDAMVVVGARSALFTPIRDLGIIVIDEEHEGSYKQDSAPRYHAREVACWMAHRTGAALVLGSATPSIETLHACATRDTWHRVVLSHRANGRPLPVVTVVDMAREFRDGSRSMFSSKLASDLHETLSKGEKAILLLNQRGFAKFVLCRDCGFVPECPHCATSLTYHEFEGLLTCHHCGFSQPIAARCPRCSSPYLKKFGAGTQRVESELMHLLAGFEDVDARVIRMDADTTRKKGAHRELLEAFMASGPAVLLGTQMIAKGLDFDDVTLVGVINADTMLKLPDFRSSERTYDLIEQVAGRAGRASLPGKVTVQTYWAESSAIVAASKHDRALFLRDELPKRKMLGYPPYVRMANILVWGKDAQKVKAEATKLYEDIAGITRRQSKQGWVVLPSTPCAISKLRDMFRWHIVVKAPASDDIAALLHPYFKSRQPVPGIPVAVDIDPLSLV